MTENQPSKSTEISKWSDKAMFEAEPLKASDGPQVFLLSMNPDPLGSIAAAALMYKGVVIRDLGEITDDQRREMFDQINKTKLKAPFEFVKIHMLFENVHRGLTHQLVRQRTAVYAQESMRFAVKQGMSETTHLPPSLAQFNNPSLVRDLLDRVGHTETDWLYPANVTDLEKQFLIWYDTMKKVEQGYDSLVNLGMPAEDARGIAPTNISTRVHYATDLRALADHAGNRLCTQAQFEWRQLWLKIIPAIRAFGAEQTYRAPDGRFKSSAWQFAAIANMFRPVCYYTGKCEFAAMDLDRSCTIRSRVDENAGIGRKSSDWDKDWHGPSPTSPTGAEGYIGAISPAEWLADPAAARVKR